MAPSPEHDNEPKAPDKNDNKNKNSVNKLGTDLLDLDPSNDIQVSAFFIVSNTHTMSN